ncbi:MAG: argininosuccinate lyase [Nitrososphaerales archaeon]|nr:argininosuccinate lyase [Nitrososphaerales archaeon]
MDVRGRRLRKQSDETTAFVSSMAFDGQIAGRVIRTNMAHMVSLVRAGQVPRAVGARCLRFLSSAPAVVKPGAVAEDFHQQLEQEAVDSLGVDVAGYINLGKSRNDQVATAIRMEARGQLVSLLEAVSGLQDVILSVARKYGGTIIPGYTHLQRAQPVTVAHHFFAYFDSFQRDVQRLLQLYDRINVSPMGSAALGGTSVKVDRKLVADLLGFQSVTSNAMDAVSSRDLVLECIWCATMVMVDLSRLAEEQILWSSKEFGFVELTDEYTASSSIMPQKKNPVVAEIARAKSGSVMGSLMAATAIVKALPYSYNLDLQETTPHLWRALADSTSSVTMLGRSLSTMKFNLDAIRRSISNDYSTATALANHLVEKDGISFRQAHAIVGELVKASLEEGVPFAEAVSKRMPSVSSKIARKISMDKREVEEVLDPSAYLESVTTEGGSNPRFIPEELKRRSASLDATRASLSRLKASLAASEKKLLREVDLITKEVKK